MLRRIAAFTLVAFLCVAAPADDQTAPAAKPAEPAVDRRMANAIDRIAVSPDGKWIAASDVRGALMLVSAETAEKRNIVSPGAAKFERLVFTADGSVLVAVAAQDGGKKTIRFVPVTGKPDAKPREADADAVLDIGAEPGGSKVRLLRQSAVEIWDAAAGAKIESRKNDPYSQACVQSDDGSLTAAAATSRFWITDAASGKPRWQVDLERVTMAGKKVDTMWTGACRVLGFADAARVLVVFSDVEETKDPGTSTGQSLEKRTKKTTSVEGRSVTDGAQTWHHDVSESVAASDVLVTPGTVAVVDGGKLAFLDAANGQLRENAPETSKYSCVAATKDGLTFWAGTDDGRIVKVKTFPAPAPK